MKVYTYDIRSVETPDYVVVCESMQKLLRNSDVLSVHVPLNADTTGLIGSGELSALPDGALLINTSRGELIDEDPLIEALDSGQVHGAAVDVVANEEKYQANRLIDFARSHSNLIITPHIGGATYEAIEKTDLFLIERLKNYVGIQS